MAFEDFTDWTETDPKSELLVTTNKIEASGFNSDASSRVVGDYGVAHFTGDFEHQFEATFTEEAAANFYVLYWLGNGSGNHWDDGEIVLYAGKNSEDFTLYYSDSVIDGEVGVSGMNWGTKYFITMSRDSGETTLTVRTTSHTGSVVGTVNQSTNNTNYRYLGMAGEE